MKHVYLAAGLGTGIILGTVLAETTDTLSKLRDLGAYLHVVESTPPITQEGQDDDSLHHADHEHSNGPQKVAKAANSDPASDEESHHQNSGNIAMDAEQIGAANIEVKPVKSGAIKNRLRVPGTIMPNRNRVARVPSKVVGTVAELKTRLGDPVSAGEIIAVLDSREVADAKSEYIAAIVKFRLQDTLYQRQKILWEKKVTSEQALLKAEATYQEAQVRRDVARQKLSALGVGDEIVAKLTEGEKPSSGLERYEIKAPIGGRIVEQLVDIGTPMGGDGQAHELYAIADLTEVWVELTVSMQDLSQIKEGQHVNIETNDDGSNRAVGTIVFTNPVLNQDTRSARVIASVENSEGIWRPGSFVTAEVVVAETKAEIVVPKDAIQSIKGEDRVFVRTDDGFEVRQVDIGKGDDHSTEVLSGLTAGERIATANTFLLKAELGKSEAEHDH
jgi:cobalt-zinc-cadmium efflux system membrane fusion protein